MNGNAHKWKNRLEKCVHDTGTTLKKRANLFEQLTFGDKTMGDLYSYLNQFFFFFCTELVNL